MMVSPKTLFSRPTRFTAALALVCLLCFGCNPPAQTRPADPGIAQLPRATHNAATHDEASHDLSTDEGAGGHTLRKHVGRTDQELSERLQREDISASSTYTDRAAAEGAVGEALLQNQGRIEQWLARSGGHSNLVLDYHGDRPIGRTLHRGDTASAPCADAKVVLRWLSSNEYYVLTSYPECR